MSPKNLDKTNVVALILAAGSSSRLGQSKQSLIINKQTLLQQTAQVIKNSKALDLLVVLGCDASVHQKSIDTLSIPTSTNDDWEKGMGSSIKHGLKVIQKSHPKIKGVLISVCDQPFLNTKHINKMIKLFESHADEIIASNYESTNGVPVIFPCHLFPHLLEINDNSGAQKLIYKLNKSVLSVPFTKGAIDIDTPADLALLRTKFML